MRLRERRLYCAMHRSPGPSKGQCELFGDRAHNDGVHSDRASRVSTTLVTRRTSVFCVVFGTSRRIQVTGSTTLSNARLRC